MWRIILMSVCLAVGGCAATSERPVAADKPADIAFAFPVIEVKGTPEQIGQEYGQALSSPMHLLFEAYLKPWFANDLKRWSAELAARAFEAHIPQEYLTELDAISQASGLGRNQLLLAQCFLDLTPVTACSTVTLPASASPDGVGRFGRNLDFPGMGVAARQTVVLIYHPQGRYAFAAVGWPGLMGVVSGMNQWGLTLANMEVPRGTGWPRAMPYPLLYRTILERCRTVEEAIDLLKKTPRQTANNLMLMDAAGNRAVAEITPEKVVVRRGIAGAALVSTNHQRGQDRTTPGRSRRYDCLRAESEEEFGRIGVGRIESMLRDVAQGEMTLQSMIFEPQTRRLYLAVGEDAPRGRFYRLDLSRYFGISSKD
jgi:predicted choloylglycine hydrolase